MYLYVMYIYAYVCTYIHTYIYMYMHAHVRVHICTRRMLQIPSHTSLGRVDTPFTCNACHRPSPSMQNFPRAWCVGRPLDHRLHRLGLSTNQFVRIMASRLMPGDVHNQSRLQIRHRWINRHGHRLTSSPSVATA